MCLCLAFTQNHLIKFQEIQSPAVHSGFRTYRWLNVEIWQGLSGSLLIIPGCSCGGQVNASRKSRMGVSGCLCTKNSGQTIHSHTFNTQILFDPFIIVVVDITSLCLGNLSSLACTALHPLCNATPLLYLENSQGLMESGAVLPPLAREVMMCEMVSFTAGDNALAPGCPGREGAWSRKAPSL